MSRKRLTDYNPQKLTEFAFKPAEKVSVLKDGAGSAAPGELRASYTDLPDAEPANTHHPDTPGGSDHHPDCDPLTSSPAKAKMRLEAPPQQTPMTQIEAQAFNPFSSNQALRSSMASFPTSGQPVLDSTLKDMLISLQASLMTDLSSLFTKVTADIHSLDDRVTTIERGMTECTSTVNGVIDVYADIREEQAWLRAKLSDLEDRSRRNNIKLRGVPETIPPADLLKYAKELMHIILPEASPRDLIVDRIHRIPKPSHLAATVPRDVLMRVHFFHIKENLMFGARAKVPLPAPFAGVQMFPDLSKYTLQLRRQLNPITKGLQNHKIQYKWRHPATLLITKDGKSHVVSELTAGLKLLHAWGILTEPPAPLPPRTGNTQARRNLDQNFK